MRPQQITKFYKANHMNLFDNYQAHKKKSQFLSRIAIRLGVQTCVTPIHDDELKSRLRIPKQQEETLNQLINLYTKRLNSKAKNLKHQNFLRIWQ